MTTYLIKNYMMLKNKLFLLGMCLLVSLSAIAQMHGGYRPRVVVRRHMPRVTTAPPTYRDGCAWRNTYYGLRLGLNASNVRSEATILDGNGVKTGLNIGAVVGTQLSRHTPLFVETGLYYTQKGGKSDNGGGRGKFTYELNYLQLPLLLKYRHFTMSGLTVEPFAGAYLACGIAGNIKDYGERQAFSSYSNGYFNRFDGGLRFGCGVGYGLGYAELAYDLGLANVGQDNFDNTHNGCFTISIGVNF